MTQKIVNVSEIEGLQRFNIDHKGLPFIEDDGNWIAFNDIRALLDKSPSVSGEAVASNKAVLIDADSNEFLIAKMRIWNEYSSTYRDSGDDGVNRSKALHKGIIEGIKLAVNEYNLYTAPQPDRIAELEAKLKVAVACLVNLKINYNLVGFPLELIEEVLVKIED